MGRQFRSPRAGGGHSLVREFDFVGPTPSAASSTGVLIPSYGVTDISTWAAGDYVMAPPERGVEKRIVSIQGTSAARVIRLSTGVTVKVGSTAHTQLAIGNSTVACAITLMGYNSTQWLIMAAHPVATTGAGITSATS